MDYYFWFIQLVGLISWLLVVFSYYRKNTSEILFLQILSIILCCVHYYFLSAYSGLFICICSLFIHFLYYKTDKDDYIFLLSIPVYLIGGVFCFKKVADIFPIIASIIDGYSIIKDRKVIVIGAIISYMLWTIYDIVVLSYFGVITDIIVILSNLFILISDYSNFKGDRSGNCP